MRKCYLSKSYKELNSAGSKAKTDMENILAANGFVNVGLAQAIHKNKITNFLYTLTSIVKGFFCLKKGDLLFMQYPLKKYYVLVCRMAHVRGAKVVTLIHDLGSFRRKKLTPQQDIERLSHSDFIIAHNENMKRWLLENGCKQPIACIEIFDYLSKTSAQKDKSVSSPYQIIYAGALNPNKNRFLYDLVNRENSFHINLYGSGFNRDEVKNKEGFSYMGFVPSDELISQAKGDFGLVWDGESIDACAGAYGEYLKYNNPHKLPLYLRCELPVIVWEQAATAKFVTENKVGIIVKSLADLDNVFSTIDAETYARLKENAIKVSEKLAKGYYILRMLDEAERTLLAQQ